MDIEKLKKQTSETLAAMAKVVGIESGCRIVSCLEREKTRDELDMTDTWPLYNGDTLDADEMKLIYERAYHTLGCVIENANDEYPVLELYYDDNFDCALDFLTLEMATSCDESTYAYACIIRIMNAKPDEAFLDEQVDALTTHFLIIGLAAYGLAQDIINAVDNAAIHILSYISKL